MASSEDPVLHRPTAENDASLRGITLEFLLEFTYEHNGWDLPTHQVVKQLISPATAKKGEPYTSLLPPESIGFPTIFVSHAWHNPFGLVVATLRKFISSSDKQQHAHHYLWLDIFAITQHPGVLQSNDLSRLESTIARKECTTLVVLDEEHGVPLTRCWCIFEFFTTLLHAGARYGKLQVRAGSLVIGQFGEYIPCRNPEHLSHLAESVDCLEAEASVEEDKIMIVGRLEELGLGHRKGVHELNRKLARAVRHGW